VCEHVVSGQDALVVMPTGSGKSLCYQLPALARPGTALVVTPLIALMKDQVDALLVRGVRAACIHSGLGAEERRDVFQRMRSGQLELLYVAPERFAYGMTEWAKEHLQVSLLAVDEAHCMSEWGHDFRPDYLRLGAVREALGCPPTVALTATATVEVQDDIARTLGIDDAQRFVTGFDRPNLSLCVREVSGAADKRRLLPRLLDATPALIYCATRKNVDEVGEILGRSGMRVARYHAGMGHGDRKSAQEAFMGGAVDVVVATNAFGMGVDKADVRTVIHHDLPKSLEAYYQEIGRAGRDGLPARATLLFAWQDKHIQTWLIESSHPAPADVAAVWRALAALPEAASGEPMRVPLHRLTGAVAAGNDAERKVRSAIVALRREGRVRLARRDEVADAQALESTITLELRDPGEPLVLDEARFARLKERDLQKLEKLVNYTRSRCRRKAIMSYFGEKPAWARCGTCDVCSAASVKTGPVEALSAGGKLRVQALLGVLASMSRGMDKGFGATLITKVARGERDDTVARFRFDDLPCFGVLKDRPQAEVREWLDALVGAGLMERQTVSRVVREKAVTYDELRLTDVGERVAEGADVPSGLPLGAFEVGPERAPKPVLRRFVAPGGRVEIEPAAPPKRRAAAEAPAPRKASTPTDTSEALERLKSVRAALASETGLPAYVIASNETLLALAEVRPRTQRELLTVRGFGDKRVTRWGRAFLEALGEAPP
jgi:ATP-dependent DNA helicase RecQ